MKELDFDYDLTVDNMVPITTEYNGWENTEGEFYSINKSGFVKMPLLSKDGKQIFQMKDGCYIIEIEDEEMNVDYFYSHDINDLL
jgi:hypothetical protein